MRSRVLSGVGLAVTLGSLVALVILSQPVSQLLSRTGQAESGQMLLFTAIGVVFSATGAFLVWRAPNPIGWALLGIGLSLGLLWVGIVLHARHLDGAELGTITRVFAVWIGFAWVPALFLLAVFLPLLFPTGGPPTPVWRWVAVVAATGMIGGFIGAGIDALIHPPEAVLMDESLTWLLVNVTLVVSALGAVASVVARVRHAGPVERQQIKWVAFALGVVASLVLVSLTPMGATVLGDNPVAQNLFLSSFTLIPLSIVVAIARYRLYAIDRIISRTVSYAVVAGLLALVYLGTVLTLSLLVPSGGSELTVAVSTLAVALLFNPLRRRTQSLVDQRFNRAAVDRERELAALRTQLRDMTDPEQIRQAALDLITRTLEPSAAGAWIRR